VPPAAHEELAVEDFPFLLDHYPDQQSGTGARLPYADRLPDK